MAAFIVPLALAGAAHAGPRPWPLTALPADKLTTLAPSLRDQDLALIESDPRGALKQISTVTLVAAPPAKVREVAIHPERYGQFVHNMSRSDVRREPGGTFVHDYKLDYTVASVDGRHRYVLLPPVAGQAAAPIDIYDPDDNGTRHYRWEFYAAPGSGTLLVVYGYSQIPTDGLYGKLIRRAQTLEYGLSLIPQMTLMLAVKREAERQAGAQPAPGGPQQTPNLGFLLERGAVAFFRRSGNHVAEVNLVDHCRAAPEVLAKVAGDTGHWSRFVPTLSKSTPIGPKGGLPSYEVEQSLPLMSWTTTWAVSSQPAAVDMFAIDGDLLRSRLRWDFRPLHEGQVRSEVILRSTVSFDHGSVVVRELYKLEPLFEYGIDLGLVLVILRGVRQQAEQLTPSQASAK